MITIASFIVVGGSFGAFFLTGDTVSENAADVPKAQKTVREVDLTKKQDTQPVETADNVETGSNTSESENYQTASGNGNSENKNTVEDDDGPVNIAAVGGLKYNYASNSDELGLSWDPVDGADGYEVYVATSEYPTYKKDSTVSTTKCTVLTGGAYYHVKVRAYRIKDGKKEYGPFCSEISTEPDIVFPQNISISSVRQEGQFVKVNVNPFTVDYYAEVQLYRSTDVNAEYKRVGKVNCNPRQTITVNEIYDVWPNDDQKTYYYKVRVKAFKTWPGKSDKYSSYSNVLSYKYDLDGEPDDEEEIY